MEPEFMSDALDDLHDCEPVPPVVHDVPAGYIPSLIAAGNVLRADEEFLNLVAPDMLAMKCAAQTYRPVPGARNALRHSLHQTGVL
jgi:hypothetical protein